MELFYATKNQSKIYNMRRRLEGMNITLVTPDQTELSITIEEDGTTPTENAIKKANAYYQQVKLPTIAGDSGLYIENIPPEKQPGLFVRRINGKELSNDEMIEHYSNLAKEYGDHLKAHYLTGLALLIHGKMYTIEIPDDDFILTSVPNKNRVHRGNPLDVVTIEPKSGKYYNELTDEECRELTWSFDKKCIEFLREHIC